MSGNLMEVLQVAVFMENLKQGSNREWLMSLGNHLNKVTSVTETRVETIRTSCSLNLSDLITLGKYCHVNNLFTEKNFPVSCEGNVSAPVLYNFGYELTSEEALTEMKRLGLRPATLTELLLLKAVGKEGEKKYPTVALNPNHRFFYGKKRYVPGIFYGANGSGLDLCAWDGVWRKEWNFAVIRTLKISDGIYSF